MGDTCDRRDGWMKWAIIEVKTTRFLKVSASSGGGESVNRCQWQTIIHASVQQKHRQSGVGVVMCVGTGCSSGTLL